MATPNQSLSEKKGLPLGNSFPVRKASGHGEARSHRRQAVLQEPVPVWREEGRSALQDLSVTASKKLPGIMLLCDTETCTSALKPALDCYPVRIQRLTTCREAVQRLAQQRLPVAIFTDVELPDGDWKQVLQIAQQAPVPVQVIVVSRIVDVHLYLDALDAGAFDFLVPPIREAELDYIMVNAFRACLKQKPLLSFSEH